MQKIKLFIQRFWSIFVLIIFSGIVFSLNYTPNTWLLGWDNLVPEFNLFLNIKRSIFAAWQEYQGLGLVGGMAHGASLSRELILWLFSPFISIQFTRYFWLLLMLIIGPVGTWFLTDFLFNRKGEKKFVSSFISGSFYLFNLATLQYFYPPFETFSSFYGFIPWLLFFSLKFLSNGGRKNGFNLLVLSFFATSAFQVQTLFIVYLIIMLVFSIEFLIGRPKKKKRVLQWGLISLVANLFWLIPIIYFTIFHSSVNIEAKQNQLVTSEIILMNENYGDLINILSLRGYWFDFLDKDEGGKLTYLLEPWKNYFSDESLLWVIRGLVISSLLGLFSYSVFNRKKLFSKSLFFLPIFIILLLTAGKEPLGFIYNLLQNNIPLFSQIFRTTFTKWSMVFALFISIGLGFLTDAVYQKIYKWLKPILITFVFLLIVLPVLPFFQGNLIYKRMKVDLPGEYLELFSFFNQQPKQSRIALLPTEPIWGWEINDWGHRGSGFLWYGIEQPIIHRSFDVFSKFDETFYHQFKDALRKNDLVKIRQILNIYDVNYLLFDKSIISISQKDLIEEYGVLFSELGFKEVFQKGNILVWSLENMGDSFISSPKSYEVIRMHNLFQTRMIPGEFDEFIDPLSNEIPFIEFPFSSITKEDPSNIEIYDNFISVFGKINQKDNQKINFPAWERGDKIIAFTKLSLKDGVVSIKFAPPARIRAGGEELALASLGSYDIEYRPGREIKQIVLDINEQNLVLENNQEIEYPFFDLVVGDSIYISVNEVVGGDRERGLFLRNGGGIDLEIEETVWGDWLDKQSFEVRGEELIVDVPSFSLDILDYLKDSTDQKNCDVFNRGEVEKNISGEKVIYQTNGFGTYCESLGLADIDVTYDYLISVSGETLSGRSPKLLVNSSLDNFTYLENLLPRGEFQKNYLSLSQKPREESYFINLEFKSFGDKTTEANISSLGLTYFALPIDILNNVYLEPTDYLSIENEVDVSNIKKIGTGFYSLKAESLDGGVIRLSQGFDEGWIAITSDLDIFPHTTSNGWSNAWLMPAGSYNLYIVYVPQIFVFLGFVFLIFSFITLGIKKTSKDKDSEENEELSE